MAAFEVVACKDMFSTGTALLAAFEVPCKDIYMSIAGYRSNAPLAVETASMQLSGRDRFNV